MLYHAALAQILPEYQEAVTRAVDDALAGNVPFNAEYPITGYHDQKIRIIPSQ